MRVHFIAIGGSAMHNLAIALHLKGFDVSGSDDEIFEPSKSRLQKHGLLPEVEGWKPELISEKLDAIILGMHARKDNPELLEAQKKGLKIYSYPEYLFEQTKDKLRVVIGGSHGKTTTTSMIMHVLKYWNRAFDYMVGANIDGFDTMVSLSKDAPVAIFEGDEYLSSPIDLRPKFHHYQPNVALLTGIAWDHINVFPTFENYVEQFQIFADSIEEDGSLIYFDGDENIVKIAKTQVQRIETIAYNTPENKVEEGITKLIVNGKLIALKVFGNHNLQNIAGAQKVCEKIGIPAEQFYEAIATFGGSSRRLERVAETNNSIAYYDFAHSPSKLKATTEAVKQQFTNRKLVAVMELHTFSSLQKEFLPHYNGAMDVADVAIVYFNPETIAHKKLEDITVEMVKEGFNRDDLKVYTNSDELFQYLYSLDFNQTNLLIMSSGNFSGKNIKQEAEKIIKR